MRFRRGRVPAGRDDGLAQAGPLLERVRDWPAFLAQGLDAEAHATRSLGRANGSPLGAPGFVTSLERVLGRTLTRGKPGCRLKAADGRVTGPI